MHLKVSIVDIGDPSWKIAGDNFGQVEIFIITVLKYGWETTCSRSDFEDDRKIQRVLHNKLWLPWISLQFLRSTLESMKPPLEYAIITLRSMKWMNCLPFQKPYTVTAIHDKISPSLRDLKKKLRDSLKMPTRRAASEVHALNSFLKKTAKKTRSYRDIIVLGWYRPPISQFHKQSN